MTYTYKLARRLAISRDLGMLTVLVLFAACAGETTAPETPNSSTVSDAPRSPVGFRVLPGTVTIETNQQIRFRGEVRTLRGRVSSPLLLWEASGGLIDSAGNFSASHPGTFRVVGRGRGGERMRMERLDTSVVVVVARQPGLKSIKVTPQLRELQAGQEQAFTAVGQFANGTTAPIGVNWSATGGTIDPGGLYQAGSAEGTYRVIARNTRGTVADTVEVGIIAPVTPDPIPNPTDSVPDPTPDPAPDPTPTLARVILKPASIVLPTSATQQFAAFGRNDAGDSVAVDVTFQATGGTITPTGLYTAGGTAGDYKVIARSSGFADTAVVTLARASGGGGTPVPEPTGTGIPFGPSGNVLNGTTETTPFTMLIQGVSPSSIVSYLATARAGRIRLELNMTGGKHELNFAPGGHRFDLPTWKKRMDAYNTPTIRQAVAAAVADGIIVGNSVMDEPHVHGGGDGNTWGPEGTMTKVVVDQMCGYVKAMFPTLPVGVAHRHDAFEPTKSYRVCEFIISPYSNRLGSVTTFRDAGLALARRDGHAIMFSMNIMNGGTQDRDGTWDCIGTGGKGTYSPNCRMTPQQVRDNGLVLGPAGCALSMWRYDAAFMANPENLRAFRDVAARLATLRAKPCRRQ
jgi:hypothetical protein